MLKKSDNVQKLKNKVIQSEKFDMKEVRCSTFRF